MEKRLFIAILLSFAVLYAWSVLNPPQKRPTNNTQLIENKQFITEVKADVSSIKPEAVSVQSDHQEEVTTLETDKLKFTFSNKGGNLKTIYMNGYDASHPLTDYNNISGFEDYYFDLERKDKTTVVYTYSNSFFKISKTYRASENDYLINAEIVFQNISEMSNLLDYNIENFTINVSNLNKENDPIHVRDRSYYEYLVYSAEKIFRKANAYKFKPKESKIENENVIWAGFRSRYYCTIIKPDFETQNYEFKVISDDVFKEIVHPKPISVPAGSEVKLSSTIYTGPENLDLLKSYSMDFEKVRKYYRLGIFDISAKFIYFIMHTINKVAPNWGWSIILVSIFVYLLTYPLTIKSMSSMKKMQEMAPKTQLLKEKYKDNPQKLNTELMDLYKKNKINPLGGCLPMIIQMPIFIGLYQVLWRSVEFKGASFYWIKDLTEPDRLFVFTPNIPFVGHEFNILPVLMMGIMFIQQKLSIKNAVTTDPAQIAQQKMMANVMPVILGVIFYHFAAGLTLYFTLFYLFSTITQYKMMQSPKVKATAL